MTGQEITLGSIGISVLLAIILQMVFNTWKVQDRFKAWIAVGCGMVLAITALLISGAACTPAMISTYLVQGFMTGATATGLYEMIKKHKGSE